MIKSSRNILQTYWNMLHYWTIIKMSKHQLTINFTSLSNWVKLINNFSFEANISDLLLLFFLLYIFLTACVFLTKLKLTGIWRATGSTGCLKGRDSGSWRYNFSRVGINACRNSSGLKTESAQNRVLLCIHHQFKKYPVSIYFTHGLLQ